MRKIVAGGLVILALGGLFGAIYFYVRTVIGWWLPVLVGCVAAMGAYGMTGSFRHWLGRSWGDVASALLVGVAGACLGAAAFLGLNAAYLRPGSERIEEVEVAEKFTEVSTTPHRVGRRYVHSGATKTTYKLRLRFADGDEKVMSVPVASYNRIRYGSTLRYRVSDGMFGYKVIVKDNVK